MFTTSINVSRFPVQVTILGSPPVHFVSEVISVENRQMCLVSRTSIPLDAPLKVIYEDRVWMGEVIACRSENKQWLVDIQLEHALCDVPELLRLAERFLGKRHREPVV